MIVVFIYKQTTFRLVLESEKQSLMIFFHNLVPQLFHHISIKTFFIIFRTFRMYLTADRKIHKVARKVDERSLLLSGKGSKRQLPSC